ncbi:hypothetical protein PYW07_009914 [Mythimna separata]|uniref:Uncharacterized protein n=1 Tax=Mythimna separata TaxID=271217 RepID=A0AAD7YH70_MYTSE|nr:hypothetical protein PYW07_009914 [Mythimna separata]
MENPDTLKEKPTTKTTNDGGLFLLEVFIDRVSFKKSCFSDKDFRTCVTISAPAVQTLQICDDEPEACVAKSGGPFVKTFNSGKSCLFSLPEAEITKNMGSFPIKVAVHKCPLCGCLPTKIMGITTINMTKQFVESRNKYNRFDPASVNCQALTDSFKIVSAKDGECVGDILMFLRISCFGKLIVTKFQAVGQLGSGAGRETPDTGPPYQRGGSHGGGPCPLTQDPYNSALCQDPDDICYCSDSKPSTKQPMVYRNMDQYCVPKCENLN